MKKTVAALLLTLWSCCSEAQSVKWHFDLKDVSFGQTAAKDVDGDGRLELFFSTYMNDGTVYCLNSENGTLKWKHVQSGPGGPGSGCSDAGPLVFDPFGNGNYKVVVPGSCVDSTYCFDADSGYVQWKTQTGGGDSPPSTADVDGDGKPEVLHGTFYGDVQCLNGQTGVNKWTQTIDAGHAVETEPAIVRNGGELDFVVATWDYRPDSNRIECYRAADHSLKWKRYTHNFLYHGPAVGDLFKDGNKEAVIGDYDGYLYCLRTSDGALIWKDSVSKAAGGYIGAAVTLADLDNDGYLDIIFMDGNTVRVVNRNDSAMWSYTPAADFTNFRGAVVADVNNDHVRDVTFCTNYGKVISLDGKTGAVIRSFDLRNYAVTVLGDTSSIFEVDNAPIIADFDHDGILDLFIIGGKGRSDSTTATDYGYAFCLSWGVGKGPDWTMFRHDERRTGCLCDTNGLPLPTLVNDPLPGLPGISIEPNPTTGNFTVDIELTASADLSIDLLDLTGRVKAGGVTVHGHEGLNSVRVIRANEELPDGVYLLRVAGGGIMQVKKLIIERH